jgi:hypothetical protein
MRLQLRPDWYSKIFDESYNVDCAGIYEWRIEGIGVYIGKAKVLKNRVRDYPNNVRRMLQGLHWHGNPSKDYRPIHYALRRAYEDGTVVSVSILETCDPCVRSERERHWINLRRKEALASGPPVLNSN